jgi:queuosine precursor transporter
VIGITRFVELGPMQLAVGVLPYPRSFLCTDLISQLNGRRRANFVVATGFMLNIFILGVLYLGHTLPSVPANAQPPWQVIERAKGTMLPNGVVVAASVELFTRIFASTSGAVFASMLAYIAAQFCDVQSFHFGKRWTGSSPWLRNNVSTLTSQGADSFGRDQRYLRCCVSRRQHGAGDVAGADGIELCGQSLTVALADTIPLYFIVGFLRGYLQIDHEHTF